MAMGVVDTLTMLKFCINGAVHGLEYTLKKNGGTKTKKTEANTLKFMCSTADMPNRKNVKWFDDGTF